MVGHSSSIYRRLQVSLLIAATATHRRRRHREQFATSAQKPVAADT